MIILICVQEKQNLNIQDSTRGGSRIIDFMSSCMLIFLESYETFDFIFILFHFITNSSIKDFRLDPINMESHINLHKDKFRGDLVQAAGGGLSHCDLFWQKEKREEPQKGSDNMNLLLAKFLTS